MASSLAGHLPGFDAEHLQDWPFRMRFRASTTANYAGPAEVEDELGYFLALAATAVMKQEIDLMVVLPKVLQ